MTTGNECVGVFGEEGCDNLRIRDTTWKDYGMSKRERKIVEKFCSNASGCDLMVIKIAIDSANKSIAKELYNSIVLKQSYAKQTMRNYIPIGEKDFYGYRRKAIHEIYQAIIKLGLDKRK